VAKGIFSEEEANKGLDEETVAKKEGNIIADLEDTENRLKGYSEFHKRLTELELESGQAVEEFVSACAQFKGGLDEREKGELQELIDKGYGYVVNGSVYFAVKRFPQYGMLSGRARKS